MFISSVPPFLLKTPDNPDGMDVSVSDGIKKQYRRRPSGVPLRVSLELLQR